MSASAPKATGPRTEAGKAVSRFNPIRHGLTSQHLILPGENPEDFAQLLKDIRDQWPPEHPDEEALTAKIAEGEWRMIRARRVESATLKLYMERVMAEDPQAAQDPDRALALVFDRYGKELDRLRRYETTISRALAKTWQELRDLVRGRAAAPQTEYEPRPEDAVLAAAGFVSQNRSDAPVDAPGARLQPAVVSVAVTSEALL